MVGSVGKRVRRQQMWLQRGMALIETIQIHVYFTLQVCNLSNVCFSIRQRSQAMYITSNQWHQYDKK